MMTMRRQRGRPDSQCNVDNDMCLRSVIELDGPCAGTTTGVDHAGSVGVDASGVEVVRERQALTYCAVHLSFRKKHVPYVFDSVLVRN